MADDSTPSTVSKTPDAGLAPDPASLVRYIEEMLLELAQLASAAGETALAASLALTAIQAGAAVARRPDVVRSSASGGR